MSLTIRAMQNGTNAAGPVTNETQKQTSGNRKSVFAGDLGLNSGTDSIVEQKRQYARKQAMKLVRDAWGKEEKASQDIEDMQSLKNDKVSEMQESQTRINEIEEAKTALQEEYQVDPDSQEQKDLELLEKFQDYQSGVDYPDFSEEEVERLRELQDTPRTEYQNAVLKLNGTEGEVKKDLQTAKLQVAAMKGAITDAKIDQLKSQDMLEASDAADEIMEAAGREILNPLIQEGKDNIDEKMEDEQEKAEEEQEKKEEQQESIEEAKEWRKEQKEIIRGEQEVKMMEADVSQSKQNADDIETVQKSVLKIIEENNLVNEDLKGIEIDFNF